MIEAHFFLSETFSSRTLLSQISGHAGFAKAGKDIVCAAVSMSMNTLALSLERIAGASVFVDTNEEYCLYVEHVRYPDKADTLIRAAIIAIAYLAEQYPENVKIQVMQRK